MRKLIPGLLAVAAATAFSIWAYPQLPAEVATHFDFSGKANGWSSRLFAAIMVPALGLVMLVLFKVLPQIDPRWKNYEQFGSTYWIIANAVLVLITSIHVLTLGMALGWTINMQRIAPLAIGGMFVLLGNLMTRIRPNWFMGIRTPWTLSSDTVWRKTHRFGGVVFVIAGLAMVASAMATGTWALKLALGIGGAAALSSIVYSYIVWRGEQGTDARTGG